MPSPNEITIPQLARLIGTPNAPIVYDVRIDDDFEAHSDFIPTAIRHPHNNIASLAQELREQNVIIYCQKGKKLSQGAMAILPQSGVRAESLQVRTLFACIGCLLPIFLVSNFMSFLLMVESLRLPS